jgi:hypothetical protein
VGRLGALCCARPGQALCHCVTRHGHVDALVLCQRQVPGACSGAAVARPEADSCAGAGAALQDSQMADSGLQEQQLYDCLQRALAARDAAAADRDTARAERDAARAGRDRAVADKNAIAAELEAALAQVCTASIASRCVLPALPAAKHVCGCQPITAVGCQPACCEVLWCAGVQRSAQCCCGARCQTCSLAVDVAIQAQWLNHALTHSLAPQP